MNKVATMERGEREELFSETAARLGVADAIVEKDFWVCWVLKQLFSNNAFEERLLFKGGTSLSKIFHAINRFSEDIDLAVDYVALGFTGDKDPLCPTVSLRTLPRWCFRSNQCVLATLSYWGLCERIRPSVASTH